MKNLLSFLFACAALAACSPAPTPSNDAAIDAAADALPDAPSDALSEAGVCADFGGAYTFVGSCSAPGLTIFDAACVTQSGCGAVFAANPLAAAASIVGDTLSVEVVLGTTAHTCTATLSDATHMTVRCAAEDGTPLCDAEGTRVSFAAARSFCCDVRAQRCGAGQRCTVLGSGNSIPSSVTACVPDGTLAEGASCSRGPDGRVGTDACSAGLTCVNYGQTSAEQRTCQRLCSNASDCASGEMCQVQSWSPRAGVCRRRCTVQGSDCAAGLTCRGALSWGPTTEPPEVRTACSFVGSGALGARCTSGNTCAAGLECSTFAGEPMACHTSCDATHPCAAPLTCRAYVDGANADGIGSCGPAA